MTPARAVPSSDPFADRRLHPRVSVALPAFLSVGEERHQVQIVDLSAGGAKLHAALGPLTGQTVVLHCGGAPTAGEVRWQEGPFMGLRFLEEMDPRHVAALADRSSALMARMKG